MEDRKLAELISLSDETFAQYILREDLFYEKIQDKEEIIKESLEIGQRVGEAKKDIFSDIDGLRDFYDLEIKYKEDKSEFGYYELAYFEDDKIIFNDENIRKIEDMASLNNLPIFEEIKIIDIILAHELYHKIEEEDKLPTDRVYITYKKMGFITKKVKLNAPSEIGAMAFAKSFLGLEVNPLIINYLLAKAYDKEEILFRKIYKDIK
ncbi:hypothetical protein [uncultured Anaerococcus sp.]|uniref:hypothetical protein n=1 Tax=uncultured Anaerococcus sp. TaxID=293428 RepID=UPI00280497A7|nr:hypothetical protein [uncultured Anaerococcus sp.]